MGTGMWHRTSVRVLGVSVLVAVVAGVLTFFLARPSASDATVLGSATTAGSPATGPATTAASATSPAPPTTVAPPTTAAATTASPGPTASPGATAAPPLGDTPLFVIPAGGSTIEPFSGRKPSGIEFTKNVHDFVVEVTWASWGLKEAVGHGIVANEQPQLDPRLDEQRATVVFSDPVDGKFTRALVSVSTRPDAVYTYGSGRWPLKAKP